MTTGIWVSTATFRLALLVLDLLAETTLDISHYAMISEICNVRDWWKPDRLLSGGLRDRCN